VTFFLILDLHNISLGIYYRLFNLLEDEAHCLDFQIAPTSSTAQQQSSAIDTYVKNLQSLSSLREDRSSLEERAATVEQVLTLCAVNQSSRFTTTPQLVTAMTEEAAKLRNELQGIVRARKF
jgi:hypothetical protein